MKGDQSNASSVRSKWVFKIKVEANGRATYYCSPIGSKLELEPTCYRRCLSPASVRGRRLP